MRSAHALESNGLPDGLTVQRPSRRGRQVEQMLAAFQLNLTALSYIALLVGLFLIYNTVSASVVHSGWLERNSGRAVTTSKTGLGASRPAV